MAELRRLRQLEEANRKLKQLVADLNASFLDLCQADTGGCQVEPKFIADPGGFLCILPTFFSVLSIKGCHP